MKKIYQHSNAALNQNEAAEAEDADNLVYFNYSIKLQRRQAISRLAFFEALITFRFVKLLNCMHSMNQKSDATIGTSHPIVYIIQLSVKCKHPNLFLNSSPPPISFYQHCYPIIIFSSAYLKAAFFNYLKNEVQWYQFGLSKFVHYNLKATVLNPLSYRSLGTILHHQRR